MSAQQNNEGQKKPYVKPEVKEVPLRPEEAVLGSCRKSGESGLVGWCGTTCPDAGT